MIRSCPTCIPHQFQDVRYGTKMRVFTEGNKAEHKSRCTVCGKEVSNQMVKRK